MTTQGAVGAACRGLWKVNHTARCMSPVKSPTALKRKERVGAPSCEGWTLWSIPDGIRVHHQGPFSRGGKKASPPCSQTKCEHNSLLPSGGNNSNREMRDQSSFPEKVPTVTANLPSPSSLHESPGVCLLSSERGTS